MIFEPGSIGGFVPSSVTVVVPALTVGSCAPATFGSKYGVWPRQRS